MGAVVVLLVQGPAGLQQLQQQVQHCRGQLAAM
jgi:hypothetical protein